MSPMGDNNDRHRGTKFVKETNDVTSSSTSNKVKSNVDRLISEFRKHSFLSRSCGVAAKSFILLVDLLDKYYTKTNATSAGLSLGDQDPKVALAVKKAIISFFLSFRANDLGQISAAEVTSNSGVTPFSDDDDDIRRTFSPCCLLASFLETGSHAKELASGPYRTGTINPIVGSPPSSPDGLLDASHLISKRSPYSPVLLNLTQMFAVLLTVLEKEHSWQIVKMVINGLIDMLSNYPTVICETKTCDGSKIVSLGKLTIANDIAASVCKMIRVEDPSKRFPEEYEQTTPATTPGGTKKHKSDFDCQLYPLLEALVVYSSGIDPANQTLMLETFRDGLRNRFVRHNIVHALTCCLMEMPEQRVMKILPDIVQKISQSSATRSMAEPKMAFLSTLILFPKLYSSWVDDQYLCVFGTALPYTNYSDRPSADQGFDEFTAALAHRVIALWFLHCKVQLRMSLAKYIRFSLSRPIADITNEEASRDFRDRSQSMGHQARSEHVSALGDSRISSLKSQGSSSGNDSSRQLLHKELFEACMDLMSRYSTCTCSSVPQRCPQADFLVDRSSAMTWIYGQQVITIATSNCTGKAVHHGYCVACFQKIHSIPGVTTSMTSSLSSNPDESDNEKSSGHTFDHIRKRHQSAFQPRTPTAKQGKQRAFDDSNLGNLPSNKVVQSAFVGSFDGKEGLCKGLHQGWAEITVRRPSGKTSFLVRLENSLNLPCYCFSSCENNSSVSMIDVSNPHILQRTQSVQPRHGRKSLDQTAQNRSSLASSLTLTNNSNGNTSNTSSSRNSGQDLTANIRDSGSTFRRTSSSPEIERQVPLVCQASARQDYQTSTEDEIEEAKEVKDDTCLSQSPSKGGPLMRTVSLGKADSPSKGNVSRTASFKTGEWKVSSPGLHNHQRIDEGSPVVTPVVTRPQSNRKNLQIDISVIVSATAVNLTNGVKRTSFSQQGSPTKSSTPSAKSTSPTQEAHGMSDTPSPIMSSSSNIDVSRSSVSSNMRERSHTISGSTTPSTAPVITHPFESPKPQLKTQSSMVNQQPMQLNTNIDLHHHGSKSGGLSPSFVFRQLFYNPSFGDQFSEKAVLLNKTPGYSSADIERALRTIDFITPYETHKIGVVYVAPNQEKDKIAILGNNHGSYRYQKMLTDMAVLVQLKAVNQQTCYVGGLDTSEKVTDGKFAYCWQDHLTQVVFHVATLMPKKKNDPHCNEKIRHICNDYVCIAYNDSGRDFERKTISGQGHFLKVCIVITPLDCGINKVQVQTEEDVIQILGQQESFMISDGHLPLFVRQIAIHANLALDQRHQSDKVGLPFISNFVERLRNIKRLKKKVSVASSMEAASAESSTSSTPAVFSGPMNHHSVGDQIRARAMTNAGVTSSAFSLEDYPSDFTLIS